MNKALAIITAAVASLSGATACSHSAESQDDAVVLVQLGKSRLTADDLAAHMPGGLSPEDSVKYARAYIRSWIDSKLVSEIAASEIDMTEIDKQVQKYRDELIMWEYSSRRFEADHNEALPEDSIRAYYDSHKDEFVLDAPMVKGLYLKVADDSPALPTLRRLYRSRNADDIDRIEKTGLDGAVHYDYFRDNWVDWEQIESLIPFDDQGMSADRYLNAHHDIDITQGGFTYLLDISDVLHTGQTMPYEVAKVLIEDRIKFQQRRRYDATMRQELYDRSVANGKLRLNCDFSF